MKASPYSKGYSPYIREGQSQSEQGALRSKAFSHLDNIEHNYSQYQNSNLSSNQDKIAEIKKKYERILAKSNNKTNQENQIAPTQQNDVGRSASKNQNYDQNTHRSQFSRSFQTPTSNKDRRTVEIIDAPEVKHLGTKPYALREYANPAKTQVKSHLQSNRMTLNAMKSELQSKLRDLSAKTDLTSQIRNPPVSREEKKTEETTAYQAILNKYSKDITQNRNKNYSDVRASYAPNLIEESQVKPYEKKESLQQKIKETSISSYINQPKPGQKPGKQRQLSTISQISNSNHSDMQNSGDNSHKIHKYSKHSDLNENSQSHIIVQKPSTIESKYTNATWMKNVTSYLETKDKYKEQNRQQYKQPQFKLQKLQASQGLSITRTTTQQNFMNLNRLTLIQERFEQKQKTPQNNRPQHTVVSKLDSNRGQYQPKQINPPSQISSKGNPPVEQKTQIQKLKQKYNINTTASKYTNPYRQKRSQKSVASDKHEPRNSQTISKEIQKLDSRIKQIELNKKDLNMNFRPYEVSKSVSKVNNISESNRTSASISTYQKSQVYKCSDNALPSQNLNNLSNANLSSGSKDKYNARYQAYLQRVKPLYSEITLPEGTKTQSSGFAIKLVPVQNSYEEDQTQKSFSDLTSKSRMKEYMNKVELENRTDNGIEERKKKLQQKVQNSNNVKLLVKTIGQQAVYDQVLRNNKIWFASEVKQKKWNELKNQLSSLGISLNDSQLKEIFSVDQSQNNPFFSVSDNKCNMKSLAQSYKQAQRHWQQKILHKFNRGQLERQGLSVNKIDYQKKGHIQVEDLVRFLNIESGTFLRNRDVSIIYKRMCNGGSRLQFDQMLSLISM